MAGYEFEIEWPVTVNLTFQGSKQGRVHVTREAREYRARLEETVKAARDVGKLPPTPILGDVNVCMAFYPADRRLRDIDNLCKNVFDAMTKAKAWGDDNQVTRLYLVMCPPSKPAHVKIYIVPSGDENSRQKCFDWLEKHESRSEEFQRRAKNPPPMRIREN